MAGDRSEFTTTFEELKTVLEPHAPELLVKVDSAEEYSLDTPYSQKWEKELLFGAVQIKKNYVSFHLFPIYMYPDLLDDVSGDLKKRMQGKSCFNFTKVEPGLQKELMDLTRRGFERLRREGII